ncbi:hypothetical protein ACHAXT_012062 [Thalassiosira profunda]
MQQAKVVGVVFLDIDGVLCPFGGARDGVRKDTYVDGCIFPDGTMEALTDLLRRMQSITITAPPSTTNDASCEKVVARGDPVLVLSSTWRAQPRFVEEILRSFRAYVSARGLEDASVLQVWDGRLESFFDVVDPNFHATRNEEIYRWIELNAQPAAGRNFVVRSWIALDDEDLVNVEGRVLEDATKHAVQTQSAVGLAASDVEWGVRLAKKQIEEFHAYASHGS